MSLFVEWVKGARSTYSVVDEVLADAGEAVIETACSIRAKYPKALRGGGMLRPFMDRLCSENSYALPTAPSVSTFPGLQCCDYTYRVDFEYSVEDCRGEIITGDIITNIAGRILGVELRPKPTQGLTVGIVFEDCNGNPGYAISRSDNQTRIVNRASCPPSTASGAFLFWIGETFRYSLRSSSVVSPSGAGVGDCGNRDFPEPDDPPINQSDFTNTVQICGTPNDTSDQRCVDVQIDFEPTLDENGNQCFTVEGQKYCFTPDGVEKQDEPAIPEEPPSPDELEPTAEEDAEESSEEDENIVYVTTEITTLPFSGKSVFHTGTGNNDYFAGYFNWTTATSTGIYKHPSVPIRKQLQIYVKPEEATGYTTYTVNGAKIKIIKYKKPTEE